MQFTPILAIIWKFLQSGKLHEIKIFKITGKVEAFVDNSVSICLLSFSYKVYQKTIILMNFKSLENKCIL